MSPRLHTSLSLVAAALLAAAPSARAAQPTVKEVRVEGNRRVEADAVRAAMVSKKDAPYDPKRIGQDVKNVMKLGLFSDVVIEVEGAKDAPVLVVRVVERSTVREAKITGNDELSKDDLKDTMSLKAGSVLDLAAVQKDVKKIQEKYVEKGFFLAEVVYKVEDRPDNQVDVTYVVNERAKVQVKEVRFIGNAHVSEDDLISVMQTRPGGYLAFLSSSGTYKEEALQRDVQALQATYLDRGYVTVKIGRPAVALSPDKKLIYVTIPVEEGERYRIGTVKFAGQLLDQEPKLRKNLRTHPGEWFNRSEVGQDLFAIGDVYKDLGHAYANVTPLTDTDAATKTLDLTFEVQPGPVTYFETIEVVGNEKTRDKVIRRELRIYEGERFSGTGLKTSKQRVTALGFFETVEITTKRGSADDKIAALVEVKERPTGTFQIGAGFSSYENFILTGQIAQQNFFGWGQTLSLQVQWSSIRQLGQIQFVEPYLLDTRWTFAFDLYATEGIYTTFTRRSVGGNMTWGYEMNGLQDWWPFAKNLEDMRLFLTYTNERVDVTAVSLATTARSQFNSGTTSSARLSLQWDRRDNRLFPTKGHYLTVSGEAAPPFLAPRSLFGKQVNLFTRYTVDARYYYPIGWGVVARSKLTLGLIRDWDAAHPVPISELYYVGGINSVRGYRFLSISPSQTVMSSTVPDASTTLIAVGGDKQAILNLELEFPLFQSVGVRGVVFTDMGNAFAPGKWTDPAVRWSLYKSVGLGFRWFSPIGPLRFEWGFPLNRRTDPVTGQRIDEPLDFQFTIGNFF
ncbi:MAG TPA: outer membrane protein assembly factor BamA [Anaeromyxobacter sp.]